MPGSQCSLARRRARGNVYAAAAVLLLATNSFVFAFTRLAILEPMLILWMLLSLLLAYLLRRSQRPLHWIGCSVGVGVLVSLMIGTKTTAIALLPAVAYMLADSVTGGPGKYCGRVRSPRGPSQPCGARTWFT